jgi:hypothetical protein
MHKKIVANLFATITLMMIRAIPYGMGGLFPLIRKNTRDITKSTIKIKNTILAIPAVATAIPVKPKTAASTEMISNTITKLNIGFSLSEASLSLG